MTYDQLGACAVIALGFLVLGLVIGKIQDFWIDRQIKKAGSFLK